MNVAQLIEDGLLACAVIALLCVLLATAYDFRRVYREPAIRARMRKLTNTRQPHATIIIRVGSSAKIAACLRSIAECQYHKYDVVVVLDNHASRETKRVVRTVITQAHYLNSLIRIYIARRPQTEEMLLRRAYIRSQRGEFVVCLDASQILEPNSIKRAVGYLSTRTASRGVMLSERIETVSNLRELVRSLGVLSYKLAAKTVAILGLYRTSSRYSGIYRSSALLRTSRMQPVRADYDSSTLVGGRVGKSAIWIKAFGLVGGIMLLSVVAYSGVLAATLQTTIPLWTSWAIIVLWFFAAIWFDDTIRLRNKATLTAALPMSYFAIAGTLLIGGIAKMIRRSMF